MIKATMSAGVLPQNQDGFCLEGGSTLSPCVFITIYWSIKDQFEHFYPLLHDEEISSSLAMF